MIDINLLPQEMRKKEPRFKSIDFGEFDIKSLPLTNIAITAASILLAVHVLLFVVGVYSKAKASDLSKKYGAILSERKTAINLKAQIDLINKKIRAIDELMVKRFGWAKKLNDLSDSMVPGIWLSNLEYEEKTVERAQTAAGRGQNARDRAPAARTATEKATARYLILSGYASSMGEQGTALIGKFIKSLKDNPDFYSDFSDIELGSIRSERMQDQEVMSFKLTCMFKQTE